MAPRKSTASNPATDANGDVSMISNVTAASNATQAHSKPSRPSSSGGGGQGHGDGVGIDDLLLPRTLIQRLARSALPPNTSIQRDAVLAISKSATVFISYLAHAANEQSTRKTLAPQDVLQALRELEFDNVMQLGAVGKDGRLGGRLERELAVYEEVLMQKRKGAKDRKSNKAREGAEEDGERGEPSSKKARRMQTTGDQDDDNQNEDDGDEQDMLDSQLNGDGMASGGAGRVKGMRKNRKTSRTAEYGSSPAANTNGKAKDDETESDHEGGQDQDDEDDEEEEEEEGQDNDEDDDENDEDQDDDSDDNDGNEGDDVDDELEGRDHKTGRAVGLQPNGRAEIDGSDDDSD
ncbi:hypothetical protein PV10_01372 [Exophiala mesophila]|uniref:DNA polymerase epsilon subunit D n=1 Tax=Exophiala mesophila TaxID=212818 RepID=A0A0D2AFH7_EXOME|nr:uncharacterized protein PV10_01372 [Exophiala mesophila]KIV97653.1 hypothetical protein PV10_01372 [Exophiala mesophila]